MKLIIGSRGSQLALVQSRWTAAQLEAQGHVVSIEIIKTKGDIVQDRFDKMEGKGFFTKELEDALTSGAIDIAVHSLKDLPTTSPAGLKVSAIPKRESPCDVLVFPGSQETQGIMSRLNGLRVGTSSQRRAAAIAVHSPGALFEPIRGNVPTRLRKLKEGQADCLVLAQAGINRLGLDMQGFSSYPVPVQEMVPAPGQGALAIQTRSDFATPMNDLICQTTTACVNAERHILAYLEGGCQLPLGVTIQPAHKGYQLHLFLGSQQEGLAPLQLELVGASPAELAQQAIAALDSRR